MSVFRVTNRSAMTNAFVIHPSYQGSTAIEGRTTGVITASNVWDQHSTIRLDHLSIVKNGEFMLPIATPFSNQKISHSNRA